MRSTLGLREQWKLSLDLYEKPKRLHDINSLDSPEDTTVVILRDVLKEMQVLFNLRNKKAVLVSKLK